jgi:hypothetical protein
VSAAPREHLPDGALRDVEELGQVHRNHGGDVDLQYLVKGLAMKIPALLTVAPARFARRFGVRPSFKFFPLVCHQLTSLQAA